MALRPLVILATDADVGRQLGLDFRYPVIDDPAHVEILVTQGFSCVAICDPGPLDCELVVIESHLDVGGAHQHISTTPGLDPLKLNADLGTFAWVTDDDDQLLLVRHDYGPRAWGLPGGTIGIAEPPDKAVAREVKEETGYDVAVENLVAMYGRKQHIGIYFQCSLLGGEPRTEWDTEVAEIGWFDPADAPQPCSPVINLLRNDLATGKAAARFF
jgi:ADP-ribose pyrophosphatase YjhB (NUDIX family)